MSKQDRQGVRTPADIERKYDLGNINKNKDLSQKQESQINQLSQTLAQYIVSNNNAMAALTEMTAQLEEQNKAMEEMLQTMKDQSNKDFCNALKGEASGEVLYLADVSPCEHEPKVKLSSKNLFDLSQDFQEYYDGPNKYSEYEKTDTSLSILPKLTNSGMSRILSLQDILVIPQEKYVFSFDVENNLAESGVSRCMIRICDSTNSVISTAISGWNYDSVYQGYYVDIASASRVEQNIVMPNTAYKVNLLFFGNNINAQTTPIVYSNIQFEKGASATNFTKYVADLSAVNVSRYGKNLYDGTDNTLYPLFLPKGTKVIVSCDGPNKPTFAWYNKNQGRISYASMTEIYGNRNYKPITFQEDVYYVLFGLWGDNPSTNYQLEIGNSPTDFEQSTVQTETADETGTVKGITSLYPTMTLTTNTEGVVIDCEYNRDLNKALA